VIAQAAAAAKVATQMGTQNHANPNFHRVVELVQTGAIGPVREAHV
jgi:predicted dehydrogenase